MNEHEYTDPDQMRDLQALWDAARKEMDTQPIAPASPMFSDSTPEVDATELLQERRQSANQGEMDFRDMLLVSENIAKIFDTDDKIKDYTKKAGDSPNPIEPWTTDKDQDLNVTPNFSDGDTLRELSELKIRIEGLERDLHSAEVIGTEKEENSMRKEVDSIRSKIDELSQQLAPKRYQDGD